jgi:hypothetical protein
MEMHRKRKRDQEICRKPVMNPFLSAKFVREFEKKKHALHCFQTSLFPIQTIHMAVKSTKHVFANEDPCVLPL